MFNPVKCLSITLLVFLQFAFVLPIWATSHVLQSGVDLIPASRIFRSAETLSADRAFTAIENGQLEEVTPKSSHGISDKFYWILLDMSQLEDYTRPTILRVGNPHIDHAILYQKSERGFVQVGHAGDQLPFSNRTFAKRNLIFPIPLTAGTEYPCYLLFIDKRYSPVSFPIQLWDHEAFKNRDATDRMYQGVYFGALALLALFSLFAGALLPDRLLLSYGGFVTAIGLYQFTAEGLTFEFILPEATRFANISRLLFLSFALLAFIPFISYFLRLKQYLPSVYVFFKYMAVLLSATAVLAWTTYTNAGMTYVPYFLYTIYGMLLLIGLFSIGACISAWKYQKPRSWQFMLGFAGVLVGALLNAGIDYGLWSIDAFAINPSILGTIQQFTVLNLGIIWHARNQLLHKRSMECNLQFLHQEHQVLLEKSAQLQQALQNYEVHSATFNPNSAQSNALTPTPISPASPLIQLSNNQFVDLNEIAYVSANSHYLQYHFLDRSKRYTLERNQLKRAKEQLADLGFLQTHRSFLVNKQFIRKYHTNDIELSNGEKIPLSRNYRTEVLEACVHPARLAQTSH